MDTFSPNGFGWTPDLPDPRDYTIRHKKVRSLLKRLERRTVQDIPDAVDLRQGDEGEYFFTEVKDQGTLNSSTAFAVLGLLEYFERRGRGRTSAWSRMFLYKVTQGLLAPEESEVADRGADLRSTIKALLSVGVPDSRFQPYEADRFKEAPSALHYSVAKKPAKTRYIRLDKPNWDGDRIWTVVTSFIAAGFPVAFGFSVPGSLTMDPTIPWRPEFDRIQGGQSVVATGYRLNQFGRGRHALRIRSSWGRRWGDDGNGWLPDSYVRARVARDFWTLISRNWLKSGNFSCPSIICGRS